jgi:hypothetical protein
MFTVDEVNPILLISNPETFLYSRGLGELQENNIAVTVIKHVSEMMKRMQ